MRYLRPGNLYQTFFIEKRKQPIGVNGRPVISYEDTGKRLSGCLADADPDTKMRWQQMSEVVTHTIIQKGVPKAQTGDFLLLGSQTFEIKGREHIGELGIATIYYSEEKRME